MSIILEQIFFKKNNEAYWQTLLELIQYVTKNDILVIANNCIQTVNYPTVITPKHFLMFREPKRLKTNKKLVDSFLKTSEKYWYYHVPINFSMNMDPSPNAARASLLARVKNSSTSSMRWITLIPRPPPP